MALRRFIDRPAKLIDAIAQKVKCLPAIGIVHLRARVFERERHIHWREAGRIGVVVRFVGPVCERLIDNRLRDSISDRGGRVARGRCETRVVAQQRHLEIDVKLRFRSAGPDTGRSGHETMLDQIIRGVTDGLVASSLDIDGR